MNKLIILLILASLACSAQTLPIQPAPAVIYPRVDAAPTPIIAQQMAVCHTDPEKGGLRLREDAGQEEIEIMVMPEETPVMWTGGQKTPVVIPWYQIVTAGGVTGWSSSLYLCEIPIYTGY
mgnify:CR=1 FL=1